MHRRPTPVGHGVRVPGAGISQGRGAIAWVFSTHKPPTLSATDVYRVNKFEKIEGLQDNCYPKVYLDGMILNPRAPNEPYFCATFCVS